MTSPHRSARRFDSATALHVTVLVCGIVFIAFGVWLTIVGVRHESERSDTRDRVVAAVDAAHPSLVVLRVEIVDADTDDVSIARVTAGDGERVCDVVAVISGDTTNVRPPVCQ